MAEDWSVRERHRAGEVADSLAIARQQWNQWFDGNRGAPRMRRFRRHFQVLRAVLDAVDNLVRADLAKLGNSPDQAYARCRDLERSIVVTHQWFRWYAEKYEQRLDEDSASVLEAADAVIQSCWLSAWSGRQDVPPAPLAFLDHRIDAMASPKHLAPLCVRAAARAAATEPLEEPPVGLIALPAVAVRRSWWTVLMAHEVAHHVEWDLPGMADAIRKLPIAVDNEHTSLWDPWRREIFADAFSVVAVGPAAVWAIEELQWDELRVMARTAEEGSKYPPPLLRVALMGEVARSTGYDPKIPGGPEIAEWLTGQALGLPALGWLTTQLSFVPKVAEALVQLPFGLTKVDEPQVADWARILGTKDGAFSGIKNRTSARHMIAAGVRAHQHLVESEADGSAGHELHVNLARWLGSCGELGTLKSPSPTDTASIAQRIARQLITPHIEVE